MDRRDFLHNGALGTESLWLSPKTSWHSMQGDRPRGVIF